MEVLDLVTLMPLMERTRGRPEIAIGLIDGAIVKDHPDFDGQNIRELPGVTGVGCSQLSSVACQHGTLVAGMLLARRSSAAPVICPGCSLVVRPIVSEMVSGDGNLPNALGLGLGKNGGRVPRGREGESHG
jgi:hypothetical protein